MKYCAALSSISLSNISMPESEIFSPNPTSLRDDCCCAYWISMSRCALFNKLLHLKPNRSKEADKCSELCPIRLMIIPQMSTQWAVRNGILNRWITQSGDASYGALHNIEKLGKRFPEAIIVALPDETMRRRFHESETVQRVRPA